jgi:hypothetical protein
VQRDRLLIDWNSELATIHVSIIDHLDPNRPDFLCFPNGNAWATLLWDTSMDFANDVLSIV